MKSGSILLSVLWLLLSPVAVYAQDYSYSINDGTVTITDYNGAGGSVTIPATIKGLSVTSIGDGAFRNCRSLTSITIPDSVTSIGDSAFRYCLSLTSISIGNGVTSIGDEAFYDCHSLTAITIPDSVTSIGDEGLKRSQRSYFIRAEKEG